MKVKIVPAAMFVEQATSMLQQLDPAQREDMLKELRFSASLPSIEPGQENAYLLGFLVANLMIMENPTTSSATLIVLE